MNLANSGKSSEKTSASESNIHEMISKTQKLQWQFTSYDSVKNLAEFLERDPTVCDSIQIIELSLACTLDLMQTLQLRIALNELICQSVNLISISLEQFGPYNAISSLATLKQSEKLAQVSLRHNRLRADHFVNILDCLPENCQIHLDLIDNLITSSDAERVALHVPHVKSLKSMRVDDDLAIALRSKGLNQCL